MGDSIELLRADLEYAIPETWHIPRMRNVFDQYTQPENRLTHALLSCLEADRALLERFVQWTTGQRVKGSDIQVIEQSLPGEMVDLPEEEAERRGLPDGCLTDGAEWVLLIENKISARIDQNQLQRHVRTAARRGLPSPSVLVLSVGEYGGMRSAHVHAKRWTEVYAWLSGQTPTSDWAKRGVEYLEIAEARGIASGYLKEGTLTVFSGIPFGRDEPYTYPKAKRLLGLLREELRGDSRLQRALKIDPESAGRSAIKGRQLDHVWDFIGLSRPATGKAFTSYPHLTLGIHADRAVACVTFPNGLDAQGRAKLLGKSYAEFEDRIGRVTLGLELVLQNIGGASPVAIVVQRHYPSQSSPPIVDSRLEFDPRTAFSKKSKTAPKVQLQPQWLVAAYEALVNRRSNLQFQIGATFLYDDCEVVRTREIIKTIANVWLAGKPVL